MLLHHLTTVALTGGSTLINEIGVATPIAWLYLLTEFFIPLSKVLGGSIFQFLSGLIFFFNQLPSWFYFRIYCNALLIYYISQAEGYQTDALKQFNFLVHWLYPIYLGILLQLQVYWFKSLF